MKAVPLGEAQGSAVARALVAHGWDPGQAGTAADGLRPEGILLTELDPEVLEALVRQAGGLGVDVLTGDTWAVVSASRARLSTLARPWGGPPALAALSPVLGGAIGAELPRVWRTTRGLLSLNDSIIVGIVNVTPDSFSDGGERLDPAAALALVDRLMTAGAGMIDIGGESTRPGRPDPVSADEELRRVLPVVRAVVKAHPDLPISIDTVKAAVADACLGEGAAVVNDVSGLRLDPGLAKVVASHGAGLVVMHSRGTIADMATYDHADYGPDPVAEIRDELAGGLDRARAAGVGPECLVVDPGLGFGKRVGTNLLLLRALRELAALGRPILVGPSRKRFLGETTGRGVRERDVATAAACLMAYQGGARLFRVHEVGPTADALAVARAVHGDEDEATA